MHIPDGFIGPGVSAAAAVTAVGGFAVALRKARDYLTDRLVPMAALVAAFVFAGQMINFPVLPGMSGHLLGGVLAAVLVGPWAGYIVISLVLVVQSLLIADGGLTALGLNIVNMALIGAVGGYLIYRALFRLGGSRPSSVPLFAGVAAMLSVPLAAMGFVVEFALGGSVESISITLGVLDDAWNPPPHRYWRRSDHFPGGRGRDALPARPGLRLADLRRFAHRGARGMKKGLVLFGSGAVDIAGGGNCDISVRLQPARWSDVCR